MRRSGSKGPGAHLQVNEYSTLVRHCCNWAIHLWKLRGDTIREIRGIGREKRRRWMEPHFPSVRSDDPLPPLGVKNVKF